eukprot:gene10090-10246_t
MADTDPGAVLVKLKQRNRELRSACQRLALQPSSNITLQRLETEAQHARSCYDQALDERQKQASQLDRLLIQFAELKAAPSVDRQHHEQVQLLQAGLESTLQQLSQAMAVQQTYQHMLQQLQHGHAEFDQQLDQLHANIQAQQERIQQMKRQLLSGTHARQEAKHAVAAAQKQLDLGRLARSNKIQQIFNLNRRAQSQNRAPDDFPGFIREGFDITIVGEGYQMEANGLIYKDYVVGSGTSPDDGQQVVFDYTGYNESGTVIDSTYRKGRAAEVRLGINGLIPGFEMGVKGMKPGGKRRIVVPPALGPPVGPSTFFSAKQCEVFDVELRRVLKCERRQMLMFSDVVCE